MPAAPPEPEQPSTHASVVSRRGFLGVGTTLLASFGAAAVLPGVAEAATQPDGDRGREPAGDLALYRPTTVSTTDYAPTPSAFANDGLAAVGVRGSGWRAAQGDPQWIAVDLQAPCRISSLVLTFEATLDDPTFVGAGGNNPRDNTTGFEVLSAAAVAFTIDVSNDGKAWTTAYRTTSGTGGVMKIELSEPVTARWVRMTASKRSNQNPLGLNGFQVYGSCRHRRPDVTGWTNWPTSHEPAPPLRLSADGTVPIESGWRVTLDDRVDHADGAALSRDRVDTSSWLPATVPGTVLASLVEQGHLPDPVYGWNNLHVPEALSRHSWWYRRSFHLPRGLVGRGRRRVWLEFDGVNHRGDIWLNGAKVGTLTHPFARGSFDITNVLEARGEQHMAVLVAPMPYPGSPGDKGPSGYSYTDAGVNEMNRSSPTYLSISGWDWMPAVRDRASGVWNHVRLRSTGDAVIGDPRIDTVLPRLPHLDVAEITITVPVRNAAKANRRVTVTVEFAGVRASRTVTVAAGKSKDVVFDPGSHSRLRLSRPKLWWPNGYGEPALHDLTLTAVVGRAESDRKTVRCGIRHVDYEYHVPIKVDPATDSATQTVDLAAQHARYVRIKGGKRATNWGISMWRLSVVDSSTPDDDLAEGKKATASSVDYPNHEPGNAVDGDPKTRWSSTYTDGQWIQVDLGLVIGFDRVAIVWEQAYAATFTVQVSQDGAAWTDVKSVDNRPTPLKIVVNGVPVFCRGGSWGFDELLRRMLPDRMDAVMAMHRDMNFTMVRNWIGSSDREEFFAAADEHGLLVWNEFWDAFSIDPPDHDVYVDLARDTLLRYRFHPSIVVWFGCNEGNPPAPVDKALRAAVRTTTGLFYGSDSNAGVITGDGPYYWLDPTLYFTGDATGGDIGFHSEIGLPTVPVVESMRRLVGPHEAGWPIAGPWYLHDWCTKGNQAPQSYLSAIEARLDTSDSLEDFCCKAQFVNYESMRAIFEAWNSRLWHNATGVLLWMSNPAWHSTVWQTYDYDLDINGSYFGARKGCEPLHIQANLHDWSVVAVNHTTEDVKGATATASLYDLDGRRLGSPVRRRLDIGHSSSSAAFTVPFANRQPALHLLRLELRDDRGRVLSENTYWRYRKDTDMRAFNQLRQTGVSVRTRNAGRGRGGNELVATLHNTGTAVAAMLRLSLRDRHTGKRVLPTRYSDNFCWLLPGESRDVRVSWNRGKAVREPSLVVDGYNVSPVTT